MITQQQLELGFEKGRGFQAHFQPTPRLSRAHWWFAQIRRVVDHALDRQPAPAGRPEQIWFVGSPGQRHAPPHV